MVHIEGADQQWGRQSCVLTKIFRRLLAIIYKDNGSFDSVLSVSNDFNLSENETSIYSLIFPIQKQIKNQLILTPAQNDYWNHLLIIGFT